MKSLLKILYFLFILVILVLLAGIFLPREGHVKSGIGIKASPEIVFEQINTLRNWEKWSPWFAVDTSMNIKYNDVESGTGASYSWKSAHSGEGLITITGSEPLKSVETLIDFGVQGQSYTSFQLEEEGKGTKLTWNFDNNELGYFERYFVILFRKNIQTTLNTGLNNIRSISEELRLDRCSGISMADITVQPALGIIDSASFDQIYSKEVELFSKLAAYLEKRGIQPVGQGFTLYYSTVPGKTTTFSCCYPIPAKTWGWKEYTYQELTGGKAVMLTHWGKYGSTKPFKTLKQYVVNNNLKQTGQVWEVYMNGPASEPDTSKWETQVYFAVE